MAPDEDSRRRLRVLVSDERGHRLRAGALASWLTRVAPASARGSVSIALVSDTRIRSLNRKYRRKDSTTDVLSFAADGAVRGLGNLTRAAGRGTLHRSSDGAGDRTARFLGDIVIARGVAKRQARAAGHSEAAELRVLALHGLLHLLGYDHEHDDGTMDRVERRLRRKGRLRDGLIERAAAARGSASRRAGRRPVKRS